VEFGFGLREGNCFNLAVNHGFGEIFIDGDTQVCSWAPIVLGLLRQDRVQIENKCWHRTTWTT